MIFLKANTKWLSLILSVPCGIALMVTASFYLRSKQQHFALDQFKWLLEHLSARISAGSTLEKAFFEAPSALKTLLGKKSGVYKCLKRIEFHLEANRPLDQMLPDLSRVLNCREASVCLLALPPLRQAGGNISAYIRRQQIMLSEQISLIQDLSADNAQLQTEAVIMTVMPFVMAGMLRQSSSLYQQEYFQSATGTAGLVLTYCLSIAAALMTLKLLGHLNRIFLQNRLHAKVARLIKCKIFQKAGILANNAFRAVLPEVYFSRLVQNLVFQARRQAIDQVRLANSYFFAKIIFMMAGLIPGLTMTVINPSNFYWAIFLPLACAFMHDQQLLKSSLRFKEDEQMAYPEFLNLVLVLLQSGLSLHKAINICALRYSEGHTMTILSDSLNELSKKIMLGIPVGRALSDMSAGCAVPQIQSALLMIERYDRDGGPENLHLLQMQLSVCWSNYRQAARKRQERQSLLLYLPMSLDLVAIILTAMLPAMQTLQSI